MGQGGSICAAVRIDDNRRSFKYRRAIGRLIKRKFHEFDPRRIVVVPNDEGVTIVSFELHKDTHRLGYLSQIAESIFGRAGIFYETPLDVTRAFIGGVVRTVTSINLDDGMTKQYNEQGGAFRKFALRDKVCESDFDRAIVDKSAVRMFKEDGEPTTTTVMHITLDNGFSATGTSACVNPNNYDHETGAKYALENARSKLWPIFGTELRVKLSAQEWARQRIELIKSDEGVKLFDADLTELELKIARNTAISVLTEAFDL